MSDDLYTGELHANARLLTKLIADLDADVDAWNDVPELLEADLICWAMLEEANRSLAIVRAELAKKLAAAMPDKRVVVENVGVFERHKKKDRTQWEKDDLLRVVLDSQLVDTTTGEVIDPTPLDKVLHVWNLGVPRVTALRERGIDPDEFAHVEDAGYQIRLVS